MKKSPDMLRIMTGVTDEVRVQHDSPPGRFVIQATVAAGLTNATQPPKL
jgi:hypothetical protein